MAKTISQETFDDVVKENIEDFDMSPEEATQDAVQQFEAQGVNLANIVKDFSLSQGNGGESQHPVIAAIENAKTALDADPTDSTKFLLHCSQIKEECVKDLAHRVLGGKNGAYLVLYNALEASDPVLLVAALEAMIALCCGQPDLLDIRGLLLLMKLLNANMTNTEVGQLLARLIRVNCVKHEANRQGFVKEGIIPSLMELMETNKSNGDVVKEACLGLRVLTFDDDVRVPFGKAHDHAKMIVTETGALGKILDLCNDYVSNRPVLGELYATLTCLAVRNEFCQEVLDLGGLSMMLNTLEKNMDHQPIVKQVFQVLKALAGNDEVKRVIVASSGMELILAAMTRHAKAAFVQEVGCAAIATISLRNPVHCLRVMSNNGAEVVVRAMQLHPNESSLQKQACMAVRNLVARTREHCQMFVELGVEEQIQEAISKHPDCRDEAKAALRDLGCKVELKELWKGEGKGIAR